MTNHAVYLDGFVKIKIPEAFKISSPSSTLALYQLVNEDNENFASVNNVDEVNGYIIA